MTMNKVILIGRLGKDPEMTYTQSGKAICKFSLATSEKYTDAQGQKQENTEWHNIIIWGKQAEVAGKYLNKGRMIALEGKNKTESWEDKETNKKMYRTSVEVRQLHFLSTGDQVKQSQSQRKTGSGTQTQMQTQGEPDPPSMGPDEDDIPF